jgi:hypothetical protein
LGVNLDFGGRTGQRFVMKFLHLGLAFVLTVLAASAADRAFTNADGTIRVVPRPVDPKFNNPWPPEWEKSFQARVQHTVKHFATNRLGGTSYGESEKDMYPRAMLGLLNGRRAEALKVLQSEDAQAKEDHQHTLGIDYYWCFTLKGQVRKYFYFGDDLDPAYRQRMFDAAKIWTAEEPLRRAHPKHGRGDPTKGAWGPENKGSWVDVRDTDNLRAMRDTSVYLFAEETGNEATRLLYKKKILGYVLMLFNVGQREWDSSNYHGHGLSAFHNLYDFGRDPEVKLYAKAALDWLYAVAALKYYRGGFGGPQLRDYGGSTVVFGGNAVHPLELYFGDGPFADPQPDRDDVYHVTSAYRPPQAVVEMARKKFPRPVEILSTKPAYKFWDHGTEARPRFLETLFIGHTFQMGSTVSADPEKAWNPSVFSLMISNAQRGVEYFGANTSPLAGHSEKLAGDQLAQNRNLLLWLRPAAPARTFHFQIPRGAKSEVEDGIWFLAFEKTWIALRPINLSGRTESPLDPKKASANTRYKDELFLQSETQGDSFAGFALEVAESGSWSDFKRDVKSKSQLDLSGLKNGEVELTGRHGHKLKLAHNAQNDLPRVWRNGTLHDWSRQLDLYQPVNATAPISLGWQKGALRVEAGGKIFEEAISPDGKVTFSER